ncbi:hypothetical protein AMATHDRAFT_50677 [Amanita thiersii Skay4041]|uniref:Uncharacterized protein n=1 Tax=Amanita thiersii Skay4041 TaxID=703135 RepID=A0A2A9NH09_9AGAR|nr:hypothetical protein AMATHDRAFT_50677 [Amanita thiersii Skay4041]
MGISSAIRILQKRYIPRRMNIRLEPHSNPLKVYSKNDIEGPYNKLFTHSQCLTEGALAHLVDSEGSFRLGFDPNVPASVKERFQKRCTDASKRKQKELEGEPSK